MMRNILLGMAAGAAGTAALNYVTNLDMTIRGRPASEVPSKVVETASEKAGVPLGSENEDDEVIENRKSGLGALMGSDVGLGIGSAYGLLYPVLRHVPTPVNGVVLGAAAMAASDVPATVLGVTDPREWDRDSWLSDIVPHLAYGLVTALVMDQFRQE